MATDIPKSVYLNAARAEFAAVYVSASHAAVEHLAHDPGYRAAVESVWEARGEHDAAVIRRVRALHHPAVGREPGARWCSVCSQEEEQPQPVGWWVPWPCPTIAALDAQRPVSTEGEGAAEQRWRGAVNVVVDVLPIDPDAGTTIVAWRGGVDSQPSAIWGAPEKLAEAILSALAVAGHLSGAAPAALDAGQPATGKDDTNG